MPTALGSPAHVVDFGRYFDFFGRFEHATTTGRRLKGLSGGSVNHR
jgi:hypothetical protein